MLATKSAIDQKLSGKDIEDKNKLGIFLKKVNVDDENHENLRALKLSNLFQFLLAYIKREKLEGDNNANDVIKNLGNRIKNQTSRWSVKKIQDHIGIVYKAVKEYNQPIASLGNLSGIKKVVGHDIGFQAVPDIFASLDAQTFGVGKNKPYSLLHYIFEFKPYSGGGVKLPGGNLNVGGKKPSPIELIPDEGTVRQRLLGLEKELQQVGDKDYSSTYFKLRKGMTPTFLKVDSDLKKAIKQKAPTKKAPMDKGGWRQDYIDAYTGFFREANIYAAVAKALKDIINTKILNLENDEKHLQKTLKTVEESRRILLEGHLLLHGHDLPKKHPIPVHKKSDPLPVPLVVNPIPPMDPSAKVQYETLTAHQKDIETKLQVGALSTLGEISALYGTYINPDDLLKKAFPKEPTLPNQVKAFEINDEVIDKTGEEFIKSNLGKQFLNKIASTPMK